MSDEATPTDTDAPGLSRRSLIKRAAAAGVVAWTAPVILDSLASPAAAATCSSCYKFEFTGVDDATKAVPGDNEIETWDMYVSKFDDDSKGGSTLSYRVGSNAPVTSSSSSGFTIPGDSSCANAIKSAKMADMGVTLTGSFEFSQRGAPTGTVAFKQDTGTYGNGTLTTNKAFAGCSGPLKLVGTAVIFRDNGKGSNDAGKTHYWAQSASPTDTLPTALNSGTTPPTQGATFSTFPGLIQSISTTSVTFVMPGSNSGSSSVNTGNYWSTDKPGHSGAFMFVVGCNCT